MTLLGRMFADDEELGKKDDDRKSRASNLQLPAWSARKPTPWRRRRVLYGFLACITLYLFVKNIPVPDHPPMNLRPSYGTSPGHVPAQIFKPVTETSAQRPPHPDKPSEAEKHYYDGPIKFYKLAASLYAISRLRGQFQLNKNVLFAASNLRSASELVPIACEMANWDRNDVHFAVMGRDDLELDEIRSVNGIDDDCKVTWHDARPDFSPWSSDFRMEVSVSAAVGHIETFMHPQVIIMDDSSREDAFFTKAIRAKASELGKSVIELPSNAAEKLMWIARLDSSSLAAWQTTYVEILIHAPLRSSGSLLRILRSIEAADYFGHRRPHLTIDLPAEIDHPTKRYLEGMVWPPVDSSASSHASQVTLRHRISRRASTVEEASLRLVESFYPARPADSHVLVLSPQVELSPVYFHFLMYHLLEYKYASSAPMSTAVQHLMGISLEMPTMHLNESEMFEPPMIHSKAKGAEDSREEPTPFLWQAPSSNAALYFGDKWVEFHSFLTSRVSVDPATVPPRPNLISEHYPSWLEYILELMRARGYTLLYPNFSSDRESIAAVHYELFKPPEEFTKSKPEADTPAPPLDPDTETFPTDPSGHREKHVESVPLRTKLTSLLPNRGLVVPALSDLPLLSHQGIELSSSLLSTTARSFTRDFRRQVGLCAATYSPKPEPMKADDLFCNNDPKHRAGRGLGDLDSDQPFAAGRPREYVPPKPVMKDDDAIRQSEFEAHLSRQAGKKEEAPIKEEDASSKNEEKETEEKSNETPERNTKRGNMAEFNDFLKKAEKEKGSKLKETQAEPEEKQKDTAKAEEPKENVETDDGEQKPSGKDRGW